MDMHKLIKERRMRRAIITPSDLMEFFIPSQEGFIRIPQFYRLPTDAVCTEVKYNEVIDGFLFTFYHPEFPKVEHGEAVPIEYTEHRILEFLETPRDQKNIDSELSESQKDGD